MFTYSERDMHRMPAPMRTHLPIKADIVKSGIMEDDLAGREGEPDPNLVRLPAPALHGTFSKAYSLLTRLAARIGWDDLLKCRSSVFVMEEEYRILKAREEERKTSFSHSVKEEPVKDEHVATPAGAEEKSNEEEKEKSDEPVEEEKKEKEEESAQETKEEEEGAEEVTEKMEDVNLNDDEQKEIKPSLPETNLSRPQQAAEEPKVNIW